MNKKMIGEELKSELAKGYDIIKISRWAFHIFSENIRKLDPYSREILEKLFAMEDDPQFELTEDELQDIADELIAEGEKEELSKPLPEIQDIAIKLEGNWILCPLSQESWENFSEYAMVRCPKCNNKLHNPKFSK